MTASLTAQQRAAIIAWAEKTPCVKAVRLFGSRAKESSGSESDVDLAVTIEPDHSNLEGIFACEREGWESELSSAIELRAELKPFDQTIAPKVFASCQEASILLWQRKSAD